MPQSTKIATCCYCGARAALVLSGQIRRELSCASCGAPLHDLKMLRLDRAGAGGAAPAPAAKPPKRKKARRKKGLVARVLDEALDLVEDIFD